MLDMLGLDISVRDPDDRNGDLTVEFVASSGTFTTAAGTSTLGFSGSGTDTVTLTGTNAELRSFFTNMTTATFTYTDSSGGTNTITVTATDEDGLVTIKTFTVVVRDAVAPVINPPDSAFVADVGVPLSVIDMTTGVTDADDTGQPAILNVSIAGGSLQAVAGNSGLVIEAWDGYVEATPDNPSLTQDFVFFVDLSTLPTSWWDAVSSDGRDIRVTESDNSVLPRDIIEFNKNNSTGLLAFKKDKLTTDEAVRIWVGNTKAIAPAVDDTYGQYNTYFSSYLGFWPDGGAIDRTINQRHLTQFGANPALLPTTISPLNSTATRYLGSGGNSRVNQISGLSLSLPLTMLALVKTRTGFSANPGFCTVCNSTSGDADSTNSSLNFGRTTVKDIRALSVSNTGTTAAAVGNIAGLVENWEHSGAVFGSTSSRTAYLDGVAGTTVGGTITTDALNRFRIGADPRLEGNRVSAQSDMCFVSLRGVALGVSAISYENKMLSDQSTFWNGWTWNTASPGDGPGGVSAIGSINQINAFLNTATTGTLTFTPSSAGGSTVNYTVTDADGQSGTDSQTITSGHPPVIAVPATDLTATVSVNFNIEGTGFDVTDADASGDSTAVLSVLNGTLTVTVGNSGVTIDSGNGTATVNLTGTTAELSSLLNDFSTGTILYLYGSLGVDTLTVTVTDSTSRVGTGSQTVDIVADPAAWQGYASATPVASQASISDHIAFIDLSLMPSEWWATVTSNGRDIRVTDDLDANIARDLESFNYSAQTGRIVIPYDLTASPAEVRVWVGSGASTAPTAASTYGQYNAYPAAVLMCYLNGGDVDRTVNQETLNILGTIVPGDSTGLWGGASTSYGGGSGNRCQSNSIAAVARSVYAYYCADVVTEKALSGWWNTANQNQTFVQRFSSTKMAMRAAGTGTIVTAFSTDTISSGTWRFSAGFIPSTTDRKITSQGGNLGTAPGTAVSHDFGVDHTYTIGAGRYTPTNVVGYDGKLGPVIFHTDTGASNSDCLALADHYYGQIDQETFWGGGWSWTEDTITGL